MRKLFTIGSFILFGMQSLAGGIDGGGGGTLPANPISVDRVFSVIQEDAKVSLRMYFRALEGGFGNPKLFAGPKTIYDVLEETSIDVQISKPCYDAYGNEVDGSIHATNSDAICISAFRVAPKLIEERAVPEILGLIAHELSHKVGTTEEEAVAIQKKAVQDLQKVSGESSKNWLDKQARKMNVFYEIVSGAHIETMDPDAILFFIENLKTNLDIEYGSVNYQKIFQTKDLEYLRFQQAKLEMISRYAFSKSSNNLASDYSKWYKKIFKDADEVKISDTELYGGQYADLTVKKIKTPADLQQQINELKLYSMDVRKYLLDLSSDRLLSDLPNPRAPFQNAWSSFLGNYTVAAIDCSSEGNSDLEKKLRNVRSFEVLQYFSSNDPNELILAQTSMSGEQYYNMLFPEAVNNYYSLETIKVSGDKNWAQRVNQIGSSWNYMTKDILSIENSVDGYQIKRTLISYVMLSPSQTATSSLASCTYKLIKN